MLNRVFFWSYTLKNIVQFITSVVRFLKASSKCDSITLSVDTLPRSKLINYECVIRLAVLKLLSTGLRFIAEFLGPS